MRLGGDYGWHFRCNQMAVGTPCVSLSAPVDTHGGLSQDRGGEAVEGESAIMEKQNLLIPLPDGTQLAANLLVPETAGPVPAIVVYQPYLKDLHGRGTILEWQHHFARRGYACLTVDIRGTGASDGIMAPPFSPSEREDAMAMLG